MNSACARKRDLEPAALSALDAIQNRRSVRAFLPTRVPMTTVERILEIAARAPSGTNMQPWQVIVLTGAGASFCALSGAAIATWRSWPSPIARST